MKENDKSSVESRDELIKKYGAVVWDYFNCAQKSSLILWVSMRIYH
ncbi:hypothetical protein PSYCG_09600 [Psychrobacter sp. G]|nr:hypothetical protein PSYCG_09600 [Psychrobacter sp. G]